MTNRPNDGLPPPSLAEPLLSPDAKTDDASDGGGNERIIAGGGGCKSRNIPLTLSYTALAYAGRGLWSQSVLPAFVFLLCNDNPEFVGFLTAVMGAAQLLASFPSGYLADMHRRDALLKGASVVGVLAIVATSVATYAESFALLGGALAVWGLYWGMSDASLSALFADSMRDGDRSHYFTQRYILVKVGTLAGPAVALVMFAFLGNNWTVRDCAVVMAAGQALSLPAVIMLCFFSDDYVVPHGGEEEVAGTGSGSEASISPGAVSRSRPAMSSRSSMGETQATALESSSSTSDCESVGDVEGATYDQPNEDRREEDRIQDQVQPTRFCLCIPHERKIPTLVAMADLTAGLAAGMSIRYFPIFFMDNLKLFPVSVHILYALSPLGQAFLSKMAQLVSKRIGRPQTTVLFKWTGISLMVAMIVGYTCRLPVPIVCAIFLLRDSFMNSTQALNKSLLMDAVPQGERGKWSALESVNMFSWSGSAAVGGVLVMKMGLIFNFYVTASLQFVATLPLLALFREVSIETATSSPSTSYVLDTESQRSLYERRGQEGRKASYSDQEAADPLFSGQDGLGNQTLQHRAAL